MDKKDMDEKDMMKELLKAYHNNELEEVEPEGEAVPSEAFRKRMEKMISSPDKWDKYKTRDRRRDKRRRLVLRIQRALALATMLLMFFLVIAKMIAPTKIAASIPEFFLRYGNNNENIEVLVNLDAINEEDTTQKIPEVEVGYVPEGFELVENETTLQRTLLVYRGESDEDAVFQICVTPYTSKDIFVLNDKETTQIYVDAKEIIKSEHMEKKNAYLYAWRDRGYLLELYTCNVTEEEAVKIIRFISVTETHVEE
ncbi:MAG: DUF4367 domain-containing protein [Lachnospiraceae bacterium]